MNLSSGDAIQDVHIKFYESKSWETMSSYNLSRSGTTGIGQMEWNVWFVKTHVLNRGVIWG